jgi:hydroxymethylbilane synthase
MAIAQSRHVADMITERTGRPVEIVGVTTLGDVSRAQLTQIGGTGVFVSALREALLSGEVDLAVHSLKDLPTGPAPGIAVAAVPVRDDPRDALIARDGAKLADLPAGATIGCVSAVTQVFEPEEMLPAPGQGALAVECRSGEPGLAALLKAVTDRASMAAVTAERSLLEALEAGCSAPVGAFAAGFEQLLMQAAVMSTDGRRVLRARGVAPGADASQPGRNLAAELLASGAGDLISVPQGRTSVGNDVQ